MTYNDLAKTLLQRDVEVTWLDTHGQPRRSTMPYAKWMFLQMHIVAAIGAQRCGDN